MSNKKTEEMQVFISWSKDKGKEIAIKTKELLKSININAFVSEVDINGGEEVQQKILAKIKECKKLVLCFTKENKKAPWLLFEAGFARGLKKTVIPLLFDDDPNWHSWKDNPMNIAKEVKFNSENFVTEFINSFDLDDSDITKEKIKSYKKAIKSIKDKFKEVDAQCEDIVEKLTHNGTFIMENPFFRDKTAFFLSGFESYDLYKTIIDSFLYTGKYLWIYGRKNMKLFGGSFTSFFNYLKEKACGKHLGMDGIDFKCLFLDPDSDEVEGAHLQQNIFPSELNATILRAKDVIGDNSQLRKCFRLYSNKREEIIIRVDKSIIYSMPVFDANGRPALLTNSAFEVFSTDSDKGKECVRKFETVWSAAKEFNC